MVAVLWLGSDLSIKSAVSSSASETATPTTFVSRSTYLYLRHPELSGRVNRNTLALFGPNQIVAFGDAFSPTDSAFRETKGHDGTYTFRIAVPTNYTGRVFDPASDQFIETNIVRVELLDPDSINHDVPGDAILGHSQKFAIELLNNGASHPLYFNP